MKYLYLCAVFLVLGCFVVDIQSLPIDNEQSQIAVVLPAFIPAGLPAETETPEESVIANVPLSLLDVAESDVSSVDPSDGSQRSTRSLLFGGLGGKLGGLGLGFGRFGGLGFGGLHGLGGGFGGFKPLFGKHFG